MTQKEIRERFIKFFESKGHAVVPSSSLLPTDPSVLFTTAGMQQFKPYYINPAEAPDKNVVSIQKCLRTSDIDEVGDDSHLTFFEMLGNFSFGDYWKKEAIEYAHEFITKEMGLTIDYVSVFQGEEGVPADEESEKIWQSIDPALKIKRAGREDNFWGPTGEEGPCGPTTEIYVNDLEVWNIVFNEYYQSADKQLKPLAIKGIDTGMGLERLAMVVQNKSNIFETDLFSNVFSFALFAGAPDELKSGRIIADHLRASVFLIADGVQPSNKERGYILRKLIRRLLVHSKNIQIPTSVIADFMQKIIIEYGKSHSELIDNQQSIINEFTKEVTKFLLTLDKGLEEFYKKYPGLKAQELVPGQSVKPFVVGQKISGKDAFDLYQSYGFPPEVIKEIAENHLYEFDEEGFNKEMEIHKNISRAGVEKKFGGHGIHPHTITNEVGSAEGNRSFGVGVKEADLSVERREEMKKKTRLHTATHLLDAALRKVLGQELAQAGADITVERLRFDFNFPRKITPEELKQAEDMANEIVKKDLPVTFKEVDLQEALDSGAAGIFKAKYPPRVKVYTVGEDNNWFSREICAGPHVTHTGEIGHITITKEESVSGGNRRIRATVE